MKQRLGLVVSWTLAAPVLAQSNVDAGGANPANKYCWSENVGWVNWSDAASRDSGARMTARYLSGYVWSENGGWINLGPPLFWTGPADPVQHAVAGLQTGADFGINIDVATGVLSGYAWGENTGWVNFGPWSQSSAPVARIVRMAGSLNGRLFGYAWGESVGWLNLDTNVPGQFVSFCYPNCDGSTAAPILNINDFQCFLNNFAAGNLYANCDGSTATPVLNANDFQCFLNQFAVGCL